MKKFSVSVSATLLLLITSTGVAQKGPQGEPDNMLQHTLNGARTALVKGNFYLGIPVIVPMPAPSVCDLLLKSGARIMDWEVGIPIGSFRHRTYSGTSLGSGKIIPFGPRGAHIDLDGDGPEPHEPFLDVLDEFTIRLTNIDALGTTLTPGCFDFVFWSGFEILDPNRIDFCLWSGHDLVASQGKLLEEAHAFRTVGGGLTIPAIFNFVQGNLRVSSEITLTNTGYSSRSGFMDFHNGNTGEPTAPFSMSFSLPAETSRRIEVPVLGNVPVLGRLFSSGSLADVRASNLFLTVAPRLVSPLGLPEDELLGAAGLASPPLAGNHVLSVSRTSVGGNTGVLISNPNDHDGKLLLTLVDSQDETIAQAALELGMRRIVSKFFLEYFGLVPAGEFEDFDGTLRISGDVPTAVITLGTQDGFQQFSLPAGGGQIGAQ